MKWHPKPTPKLHDRRAVRVFALFPTFCQDIGMYVLFEHVYRRQIYWRPLSVLGDGWNSRWQTIGYEFYDPGEFK